MELGPIEAVTRLGRKFSAFYGTRRFITVFTRVHHWSLSFSRSVHSTSSHPVSLRSTQILSSNLCLDLSSGIFLSGFPTRTLFEFLISPMRATCPGFRCNYFYFPDEAHIYFNLFWLKLLTVEEICI